MSSTSARPMIVSLLEMAVDMAVTSTWWGSGPRMGREGGQDVVADETTGRRGIAEVDEARRRQEVRDDEAAEQLGQLRRPLLADPAGHQGCEVGGGGLEDHGEAVEVERHGHLARARGQHDLEVLVRAELTGGLDDDAHEELLERVDRGDVRLQLDEEVVAVPPSERLVEHLLATGEQSVEGGAGDAGLRGDVVDGHLGHAPALAAPLGRVEHPVLAAGDRAAGPEARQARDR